jgi:Trypsin-like peptidase domain
MNPWLKTLLVSALALTVQTTWALDAQQIFERVSPSVVVIKTADSLGSGVVYAVDYSGLTPSSTILTNCHVVKGSTQVTVERLGKKANATVKICDAERDMAILTLGGVLPTLPVRTTPLKVGEPAFAVGAPQGLELSISQGIVSQLRPSPLGKDPMIQTTAAISQGSSGGGLFDGDGRLVGLTTMYHKEGQSLNFAVPVSFVSVLRHSADGLATAAPKLNEGAAAAPFGNKKCGWVYLTTNPRLNYKTYIDYCKISGSGRYRFSWILDDTEKPIRHYEKLFYFSSSTAKHIFDCELMRFVLTSMYHYKERMAEGEIFYSYYVPEIDWKFIDITPNTKIATMAEIVCK